MALIWIAFLIMFTTVRTEDEFEWAMAPREGLEYGYKAEFQICGTSCSNCSEKAEPCSRTGLKKCFEPEKDETCCDDDYGTSCIEGYYCVWDEEDIKDGDTARAHCCKAGADPSECAAHLSISAMFSPMGDGFTVIHASTATSSPSSTQDTSTTTTDISTTTKASSTTTFTSSSTPSETAGASTAESNVSSGPSVGVKVGASVSAVAGAAIIFVAILLFMRRRERKKYSKIHGGSGFTSSGNDYDPINAPEYTAPGPFEPMRQVSTASSYYTMGHDQGDRTSMPPAIHSRSPSPPNTGDFNFVPTPLGSPNPQAMTRASYEYTVPPVVSPPDHSGFDISRNNSTAPDHIVSPPLLQLPNLGPSIGSALSPLPQEPSHVAYAQPLAPVPAPVFSPPPQELPNNGYTPSAIELPNTEQALVPTASPPPAELPGIDDRVHELPSAKDK